MKVKKISGFILLALLGATLNGQVRQPHSLYFMETIPQISQMNPAFQPRANGYIAINVNFDYHNDLALKDIFQKQGNNWYTPVEKQYDYNKLWSSIGKKATMFNLGIDVDILGFGFRTSNGYFSVGFSEHISGNFALPSDLFKITDKGFPKGTSLDFSPLRVQGMAYMQILIGYSTKVNDRLSVGVNIKPLFGQAAVATKIDKFELQTSDQQWNLDAKGSIYSSLPIEEVKKDAEGKIEDIIFREFDDYKLKDFVKDYATSFNNPGIALDLGAAYKINERFTVSASLNNLGFISWNNDLNGITFDGNYSFDGVNFDTSTDDKIKDLFKRVGDSIADAMNYVVQHDKFKTMLPPVFHAGATYDLSKSISAGFLSSTTFWRKGVRQSFNTSLNLQPYNFIALNAGATYQVKGGVYLGGGLMFLLGPLPLQFYILVDNMPVHYSTLTVDGNKLDYFPENTKTETLRIGLNFIFGRHGYVNKPMLDKGKSSWK